MPGWIIVSDADRTNLKTASHVLRKNGMRVSTVTSGHALLDCMNENGTPDLILLDMKMSDMDGFETLKDPRHFPHRGGGRGIGDPRAAAGCGRLYPQAL